MRVTVAHSCHGIKSLSSCFSIVRFSFWFPEVILSILLCLWEIGYTTMVSDKRLGFFSYCNRGNIKKVSVFCKKKKILW